MKSLSRVNQQAADALAEPSQYSNLFSGLQQASLAEQYREGDFGQGQACSGKPTHDSRNWKLH